MIAPLPHPQDVEPLSCRACGSASIYADICIRCGLCQRCDEYADDCLCSVLAEDRFNHALEVDY